MRLLVTGGAGFIGSNFVRYWVEQHPEDHVVAYDVLTYAGNRPNLADVEDRIVFVQGDICDPAAAEKTLRGDGDRHHRPLRRRVPQLPGHPRPRPLLPHQRASGTQTMLEAARQVGVARFHHISTCEVYGDLPLDTDEVFTEDSPYRPRTPYNASKAGADHAVRAYAETYGLPITITNCCNNYGPYQFPEKVIPLFTTRGPRRPAAAALRVARENRREWLHVDRPLHARSRRSSSAGEVGETYHVGSGVEASIEEIADPVLDALGKPAVAQGDRAGPPRPRPPLPARLLQAPHASSAGSPRSRSEQGLADTVAWYAEQPGLVGAAARPGTRRRGGLGPPEAGLSSADPRHRGQRAARTRPASTRWRGRVPGRRAARCALLGPEGPCPGLEPRGAGHRHRHHARSTTGTPSSTHVRSRFRPELVLHGGAFTAVDACETEVDRAFAVNAIGTRHVAEAAARSGAHLVYVSTDYVFDGDVDRPYLEWDAAEPDARSTARSKLAGERECPPGSTIVRTCVGLRRPRRQHRQDRPAPGRMATGRCASSTTSTARRRSPPTWPPAVVTLGPRPAPGHLPRDQQRRDDLVRLRPGGAGRGRAPTPTRVPAHQRPTSSTRPSRRHARPTRCSTTWRSPERAAGPARLAGRRCAASSPPCTRRESRDRH